MKRNNNNNSLVDNKNLLTSKEVYELLGVSDVTFQKKYKDFLHPIIDKKNNNKKYYNKEEVLKIKVSKEEEEIRNLENKGTKLAQKQDMAVIANAFQKHNWRLLKDTSFRLQKEIKSVPDNNYGIVKSYHIEVWKACYPKEEYYGSTR